MQLALALDHAESHAREDSSRRPVQCRSAVADRALAGLAVAHRAAARARRARAKAISPRSGRAKPAPVFSRHECSRASRCRSALATGALVVDPLAEGSFDEAALFHLLNLAREERAFLLIAARTAPTTWKITLPDLASRLRALPVVALEAPDDALLRAVIVKLFADRQLAVDENLVNFLANRIERPFAAAREAV